MKRDIPASLWPRISELLDAALELPPDRRKAFLDAACGAGAGTGTGADRNEKVDVRRIVEALLEASRTPAEFLERPAMSSALGSGFAGSPQQFAHSDPLPPTIGVTEDQAVAAAKVGPYRLLRKLGEGGMGEVWLARQTEPVQREVALKLIKAGMDSQRVVERFEAERQALSMMDHPCIAKIFDAGTTSRGAPYFVMEYIKGEPITDYCDRTRMTTRRRVELFVRVCEAVEHAHRKGIIHRDLKPSNILIALAEDRPLPKIIDFGIAKATGGRPEGNGLTQPGFLLGTPEYMSPEQVAGSADVDTRADVYALGVILYELLAGAAPFEPDALRAAGIDELRRRIREDDPPRPSTRLRTLGGLAPKVARSRGTNPGALVRALRGDLDWIVMKAIEKDRSRRYGSAAELAADIERHRAIQPVVAGPPSALYRARKLVRRHRLAVATGTAAVLALVAFGATTAAQTRRISRERDHAERVSKFFTSLFDIPDPGEQRGNAVMVRDLLDGGADRIERELADEEDLQAQLFYRIARIYVGFGLYNKGEPLIERALDIRRRLYGPEDALTRECVLGLANVKIRSGQLREGIALLEEAVRQMRVHVGPDDQKTIDAEGGLGFWYISVGRYEKAERMTRDIQHINQRRYGNDDIRIMGALSTLGINRAAQGRYEEAVSFFQQLLETEERLKMPRDAPGMGNLAESLIALGRYREVEPILNEEIEIMTGIFGPGHPEVFEATSDLARVYHGTGRSEEGERLLRDCREGQRKAFGAEHPDTLLSTRYLGLIRADRGDLDEAASLLREALEGQRRVFGATHHLTLTTARALARIEARRGRLREAEDLFAAAFESWRREPSEDRFGLRLEAYDLACLAAICGRRDDALHLLGRAVDTGWDRPRQMESDEDLRDLRGDAWFESLLVAADVSAKASAP